MKHRLLLLYSWLVKTVLFFLPDIPLIMRFRGFLYSLGMPSCGSNFQVAHNVIILLKDLLLEIMSIWQWEISYMLMEKLLLGTM